MDNKTVQLRLITFVITCLSVGGFSRLIADVSTDGTLGSATTLTGPDFTIDENLGQTSGNNLFHSFSEFDLDSSQSATFTGAINIENVIGRITSGSSSTIDGVVNNNIANANLYLINPSGIVFGENAVINTTGSFYATSAHYLKLGNNGRFDASNPGNSILTSAPPSAFGFTAAPVASLEIYGAEFNLASIADFGIIGGDVIISGDGHPVFDADGSPGYSIELTDANAVLVSLQSAGELNLNTLDTSSFSEFGDITLNDAGVRTTASSSATIYVRGGNLTMIDDSFLNNTYSGSSDSLQAGVDVEVQDAVDIQYQGSAQFRAIASEALGSGRGGDIVIRAGRLHMVGNTSGNGSIAILANSFASGASGAVVIEANDIRLEDNSSISAETISDGNAGPVSITTNELILTSNSSGATGIGAFAKNSSGGNGGDITIDADHITLEQNDFGFVFISSQGQGNSAAVQSEGGDIQINSTSLDISGGAQIAASVFQGTGDGGNIIVRADTIQIDGRSPNGFSSGIFSASQGGANTSGSSGDLVISATDINLSDGGQINTFAFSSGAAGNIDINTQNLNVENGSVVTAASFGSGRAGDINVTADDIRLFGDHQVGSFTGIFNLAGVSTAAGAGDITINTSNLDVLNGAEIENDTTGLGDAGDTVIYGDNVTVEGVNINTGEGAKIRSVTRVFGNFDAFAIGDAGTIRIDADNINVNHGGVITTSTSSMGDGGFIHLNGGDISLNQGEISASSTGSGNGGELNLNADNIFLLDSLITANSDLTGLTGNINLQASNNISLQNSQISTRANQSDGGNINIIANTIFDMTNSTVSASVSGGGGSGGNINIDPIFVILLDNSIISADALGGSGGNISITTDNFIISNDSRVTASSVLGLNGDIVIETPGNNLTETLDQLPKTQVDSSHIVLNDCQAIGKGASTFIVAKKSYISNDLLQPIDSNYGSESLAQQDSDSPIPNPAVNCS